MSVEGAYRPKEYWETLVGRRFDLREVGYPELSLAFNECIYEAMADSTARGLRRMGVTPERLRGARVLDVGAGVGFWVDFWAARGVRDITGVDLTRASAERLAARYPQHTFEQRDIAEPIPPEMEGAFDFISVMSVLNHIPVPERWEAALANVGKMLRPGGIAVVMDPMLRYRWRGGEGGNGRVRTVRQHAEVLARQGVTVEEVLPTMALLVNPVDTRSGVEYWMLLRWWSVVARIARSERAMRAARAPLYALDRAACRLGYKPTSKLIFGRKAAAGD